MSTPTEPTPTLDQLAQETEIPLPIENLFQTDPLKLTQENASLLVQYYRMQRLRFSQAEATRPTTVKKSRGPALTGESATAALDAIMDRFIKGSS